MQLRHFKIKDLFLLLFVAPLLVTCKGQPERTSPAFAFIDTVQSFTKEIPVYKDGDSSIFYALAKNKQRQLGLDSLEGGFDGLQIRVWYDFSFVRNRPLVIIINKDKEWTAAVYDLTIDWDGVKETIVSKQVRHVTPKSGWDIFAKKLLELKVVTLPDQDEIPDYGGGLDGNTYNVEIASNSRYRFYGYWEPEHYREKIWQARNIADMIKLFEQELEVK
jgi:hypothetical protein